MNYYSKKYKINPKIKEMIEKKKGKKSLSFNQIENIIKLVLKGKYKNKISLTDDDKNKIISLLEIDKFHPNNYSDDVLKNISDFFKDNFDKKMYIDFITKIVNKNYKPGQVYNNIRVYNDGLIKFLSFFEEINMGKGIIINTKFIGDVKKIYKDVSYNEETLEIKDELLNDKINIFINNIKNKYNDIKIFINEDIYVLLSDNEEFIDYITKYNFKILDIPLFYFENWDNYEN